MTVSVVVLHAAGCHLCEPAIATVDEVCSQMGLSAKHVDISASEELEARYRTSLPVVEIDGVLAFKFYVDEHDLRTRLERQLSR